MRLTEEMPVTKEGSSCGIALVILLVIPHLLPSLVLLLVIPHLLPSLVTGTSSVSRIMPSDLLVGSSSWI
jgi:hypothetical protein